MWLAWTKVARPPRPRAPQPPPAEVSRPRGGAHLPHLPPVLLAGALGIPRPHPGTGARAAGRGPRSGRSRAGPRPLHVQAGVLCSQQVDFHHQLPLSLGRDFSKNQEFGRERGGGVLVGANSGLLDEGTMEVDGGGARTAV